MHTSSNIMGEEKCRHVEYHVWRTVNLHEVLVGLHERKTAAGRHIQEYKMQMFGGRCVERREVKVFKFGPAAEAL